MITPFAVKQAQGIAVLAGALAQQRPVAAVEQAYSNSPFAPRGRAKGVLAAVPVTMAPLPVTTEQGIELDTATGAHSTPVTQAEFAVRTLQFPPTLKAV
jgi:hypothetical protein